jgi:methylated-DNA-[protein]-cysteine S-methyltransferase
MKIFVTYCPSPIGALEIRGTQEHIVAVNFVDRTRKADEKLPLCVRECAAQIDAYFRGACKAFSLRLLLQGTDFQRSVWQQLVRVPFGKTSSYSGIAAAIGKPKAYRAVGSANGKNPISIIVPCHRIIGSNGKLTGYGGGLWRKAWLLSHEKQYG